MSQHFFITGLPRTRSAWLANLLTNGMAICRHETMLKCASVGELQQRMELGLEYDVVGEAGPSLAKFLPQIMEEFPEAKFVYVRRDFDEAYESYQKAFPSLAQDMEQWQQANKGANKLLAEIPLERLLFKEYNDLDKPEVCGEIHEFCLGRPMDRKRWDILNGLRVTVIAEKAAATLAPWVKRKLLRQSDPQTEASKRWEALAREICGKEAAAFEWLMDVLAVSLTWDHIVDGDRLNLLMTDRAFEAVLCKWPFNTFWKTHSLVLAPVLSNAVAGWRHGPRDRHFDCYSQPALAVAYLLGGTEYRDRFAPRVFEMMALAQSENDRKQN